MISIGAYNAKRKQQHIHSLRGIATVIECSALRCGMTRRGQSKQNQTWETN